MNTLNLLFTFVVATMIISFGMSMMIGGPEKGKKIVAWELKQLSKMARWILKQLLQFIADTCKWAHSKL